MSRVEYAVAGQEHQQLTEMIRKQIGYLIRQCLKGINATTTHQPIQRVVLVGNTVMHHLFCGIDLEPLSHYPFEPPHLEQQDFRAADLGWELGSNPQVQFLPCPGGFVGSDILAGIMAVRMHESSDLIGLVDLGTNGEIVIGNRDGMICASTAAGPAFEGARIWMGMRAATGAIYQVRKENGTLRCSVLGNAEPRGICGSGLVDAVAVGLESNLISPTGKLTCGPGNLMLSDPVALTQTDIRQLQLAKGAIAAGVTLLLDRIGATREQLKTLYLAGAFGNYISKDSAKRIGLLDFPVEKIHPAGNTALLGAKMALFTQLSGENCCNPTAPYQQILQKIEHISLSSDPRFMDTYVEEMVFPG
jgi:uncharacterized 2Fe-2S/4Fe-4S cluster protein (DUF4445 family)